MNLTKVSGIVKIAVKAFIGIVVMYYVVVFVLFPASKKGLGMLFPPKDPPNMGFGILDQITFKKKAVANANATYTLNTKNGDLPSGFPLKMTVYKYASTIRSLEAGKRGSAHAAYLGFTNDMMVSDVKDDVYKWINKTSGGTLTIPIFTRQIDMAVPVAGREKEFAPGAIGPTKVSESAKTTLEALNRFSDPLLRNGYQNIYMGKFENDTIVETTLPYEMQLGRIDFFRNIDKYPVYGDSYTEGIISMYISGQNQTDLVRPKMIYNARDIDTRSTATYPLITVQEAWQEVSSGKGVIVDVFPKDGSHFIDYPPQRVERIIVNNIWLGYLDSDVSAKYVQPIYVFSGNYTAIGGSGSIIIYYPAIQQQYYKATPTVTSGSSTGLTKVLNGPQPAPSQSGPVQSGPTTNPTP